MKLLFAMLAGVALTTSVPVSAAPPAYYLDRAKLPFGELPGLPSTRTWGVLKGAGYRIEVHANWNGQLVDRGGRESQGTGRGSRPRL